MSTAYVPPNAEEEFGGLILSVDEARLYSVANKLSGIIFAANINARSPSWQDTRNNNPGDILEAYIEESTFYAVNGKSVLDLTITTDTHTYLCYTKYTDAKTELLMGTPTEDTFLSSVSSKFQTRPKHTSELNTTWDTPTGRSGKPYWKET